MNERRNRERGPRDVFHPRDVVSAREIALRIPALSAPRVHELRHGRLGFPEPIGRRGREIVWYWPDVRAWAGRLLARRPFKVAAVALANKRARVAWALLVKGGTYRTSATAA